MSITHLKYYSNFQTQKINEILILFKQVIVTHRKLPVTLNNAIICKKFYTKTRQFLKLASSLNKQTVKLYNVGI